MSAAGVSVGTVTMAEVDLRPAENWLVELLGSIRTFSMVTDEDGTSDLINAGDVPGGNDERCKVGFGAVFSTKVL